MLIVATCFHAGFLLSFLNLKMEAICVSEKSVDTQLTTRRYIPEDGTLHKDCCLLDSEPCSLVGRYLYMPLGGNYCR
jgi:hypothetical protein